MHAISTEVKTIIYSKQRTWPLCKIRKEDQTFVVHNKVELDVEIAHSKERIGVSSNLAVKPTCDVFATS